MPYLPSFAVIQRSVELSKAKGQLIATASYENLLRMIKLPLSTAEVDEGWYSDWYPDVADAVAEGIVASAQQHFIDNGYFEGRLPFAMPVDEAWHKNESPNVAERIRNGSEVPAQEHFVRDGYKEGRLPYPP